jgi:ABC-type phosphate transport system substrate-binding protein
VALPGPKEVVMIKRVFALLLFFSWATFSAFPDVLIITNPATELSSLKKKEVRDIFTGKKTRWNGSGKIIIAVLENSRVHKEFLWQFVRKTPSQFKNYWRRKVFTGEGKLPKSFRSEAELVEFVARTKGAVGYISSPTSRNVRAISILDSRGGGG